MIHLVEINGERPEEGKIIKAKCGKELVFRSFSPSSDRMLRICSECRKGRTTSIPNFLSVFK